MLHNGSVVKSMMSYMSTIRFERTAKTKEYGNCVIMDNTQAVARMDYTEGGKTATA